MHLDAQDKLGLAEIFDAVLAFEAVLDPLDLAEIGQDKEEVVNVEAIVVRVPPPRAAHVVAGVLLGALIAESFEGRVNPVIPELPSLLEAVQSAVKFGHLAGMFAVVDTFRYTQVQILLECAIQVRLVNISLTDRKAEAGWQE